MRIIIWEGKISDTKFRLTGKVDDDGWCTELIMESLVGNDSLGVERWIDVDYPPIKEVDRADHYRTVQAYHKLLEGHLRHDIKPVSKPVKIEIKDGCDRNFKYYLLTSGDVGPPIVVKATNVQDCIKKCLKNFRECIEDMEVDRFEIRYKDRCIYNEGFIENDFEDDGMTTDWRLMDITKKEFELYHSEQQIE